MIEELHDQIELAEDAGEWERAVILWEAALSQGPTANLCIRYSAALEKVERLDEALAAAIRAIELDSAAAGGHFQAGWLLWRLKRYDEAKVRLEQGLALEEWGEMLVILGRVLWRMEELSASEQAFRRSLQLEVSDEAHLGLGQVLAERRLFDEALWHLREARRLAPTSRPAILGLADALVMAGQPHEAIELLTSFIAEHPDESYAHFLLGTAWYAEGSRNRSQQSYRRAIEIEPDNAFYLGILAESLAEAGFADEAGALFLRALSLDVADALANRKYAQFLEQMGFPSRAREYLQRCIDRDPTDAPARAALERLSRILKSERG